MKHIHLLLIIPFLWTLSPLHAQLITQENDQGVMVLEDQQPVLFYQTAPKHHEGQYERTNYIHPLWNVDGTILTEDFPADHLHHRGVFWAWHQIRIDGKRIGDGWALEDFDQQVTGTDWKLNTTGSGTLTSRVLWSSDLYTVDDETTPYLRQDTKITVHPKKDNYRKIDFIITLTALEEPVSIGGSEDEKGYSGFSVRMKLPEDVRFTGPTGTVQPQTLAVESPGYVNISATFDSDQPGGILIIDHPDNPGYPQSWILRSARSMQNAKFPGRELFTITKESPLELRYTLVTYAGNLNANDEEKLR